MFRFEQKGKGGDMRIYRLSVALLLAIAPAAGIAACQGPAYAEFKRISPLKAAEADSAEIVTVHHDGCVSAVFPRHDRRHGKFTHVLPPKRFQQLQGEIRASRVDQLRPEKWMATQKSAGQPTTLWKVLDDDIIEFTLATDGKASTTTWRSLGSQLLNSPDDPELARVAALKQLFLELAEQAHRQVPRAAEMTR